MSFLFLMTKVKVHRHSLKWKDFASSGTLFLLALNVMLYPLGSSINRIEILQSGEHAEWSIGSTYTCRDVGKNKLILQLNKPTLLKMDRVYLPLSPVQVFLPGGYLQSCRWLWRCPDLEPKERTETQVRPQRGLNAIHRSARSPEGEECNIQSQKPILCAINTIKAGRIIKLDIENVIFFREQKVLKAFLLPERSLQAATNVVLHPLEMSLMSISLSIAPSSHRSTRRESVSAKVKNDGSWLGFL